MPKLRKPPGQRWLNRMSTRTKWQTSTPLSMVLVLIGLYVLQEAGYVKHTGAPPRQWALWYVYSFVFIVGGLLLFGQSVRFRAQLDYRRFVRRELKKRERLWAKTFGKRKASPKQWGGFPKTKKDDSKTAG